MMTQEHEDELEIRLAEIEHLIKDFRQTFKERTSTAENFITMTEIETMWGNLRQVTINDNSFATHKVNKDEIDLAA